MILLFSMALSCLLVALLLVLMSFVSAWESKVDGNLSYFECGFDSMSVVRRPFSYRFFLIAILFIVFDVEIILMLPIPYEDASGVSGIIFLLFLWVLLAGLLYEMQYGVLSWAS